MEPLTSNLLSGSVTRKANFKADGYLYLSSYSSPRVFHTLQADKKHRFQFRKIEIGNLIGWERAKFGAIS